MKSLELALSPANWTRDPDDPLHARLRHPPPAVTMIAVAAEGPTRLDTACALLAEVGITTVGAVTEVSA